MSMNGYAWSTYFKTKLKMVKEKTMVFEWADHTFLLFNQIFLKTLSKISEGRVS